MGRPEGRCKKWYFRYGKLEKESQDTGSDHQFIVKMFHLEYRFSHIPHPHCMKQLGHAQNRKGIGLCPVEYGFMLKHCRKIIYGKRNLPLKYHRIGDGKKGRKADPGYQQSVKTGTGKAASGKQALLRITGRPSHQSVRIVVVHPEGKCRKGIGNQVNPENMAGFQRRGKAAQHGEEHGHDFP